MFLRIAGVNYGRFMAMRCKLICQRISQMKHQLDATLCRFYFCRVTLHVSGASAHHQEYLKLSTAATGTCVIVAGKSSHLLIRAGSQMKHQLDATLCRFYFCRVTLHVSGASAHHQEY